MIRGGSCESQVQVRFKLLRFCHSLTWMKDWRDFSVVLSLIEFFLLCSDLAGCFSNFACCHLATFSPVASVLRWINDMAHIRLHFLFWEKMFALMCVNMQQLCSAAARTCPGKTQPWTHTLTYNWYCRSCIHVHPWGSWENPSCCFFLFLLELFEMLRIDKMPLITKHVQTNLARCRHLAPISEIVAIFFQTHQLKNYIIFTF